MEDGGEVDEAGVRHLVLVGPMGSGKTTIGRLVAERLGMDFVDSDDVLEREHGITARELGERSGVEALHAVETGIVLEALASRTPTVIAAAASVADSAEAVRAMDGPCDVVILDADVASLLERIRQLDHRRPIPADEFHELNQRRRDALLATRPLAIIDTSRVSPEQVVDAIVAASRASD